MKKQNNKKIAEVRGFTLIELMVVMAIIAVLAVLIIGAITIARKTAMETVHRSNAKTLLLGYEAYYMKNRTYPGYGGYSNLDTCTTFDLTCWGTVPTRGSFSGVVTDKFSGYDVTLAPGACKSGGATTGGGHVVSSTKRVALVPFTSDCSTYLFSDALTLGF